MRRGIYYNKKTGRYCINTKITLSNGTTLHFEYRPKDDKFKSYKYTESHYHELVNERKTLEEEKIKKEMEKLKELSEPSNKGENVALKSRITTEEMLYGMKYDEKTERYYIKTSFLLCNGKIFNFEFRPQDDKYKSYEFMHDHFYGIILAKRDAEDGKIIKAGKLNKKEDETSYKKVDTYENRLMEAFNNLDKNDKKYDEIGALIRESLSSIDFYGIKPCVEEVYVIAEKLNVNPLWLIGYNVNKTKEKGTKGEIISLLNKLNNEQLLKVKEILKENFKDIETK